jgi:hypothetical protein
MSGVEPSWETARLSFLVVYRKSSAGRQYDAIDPLLTRRCKPNMMSLERGICMSGRYLSGPSLKRAACIFVAVIVIGPSLSHFATTFTDSTVVRLGFAGIGGALGFFVGLAVDNYLFGRKTVD